ncbi:sulfurtransferase [Roseomonas terrae]|jgi:rhodanese-related sulfurtransferase|uniref:Sulfurtransferase n=1 Tax=Neoroseomonas terrae TaxID=424799 RepID=A0ABS5EBE2_9PROT|nr:rhodanese-like domain-containing protein [Neoroseomonas terrae]MBR0648341.1 sulfurtransferase [Neoroseomonas terrae]
MNRVSPATLKTWLHDGAEIALLDVREHGQYGEAHPFYAVPVPYSRLELDIGRLVPRQGTRIVLHDSGTEGIAERAAARLEALGYTNVGVLEGGTAAWQAAGHVLFAGVNVPSKTFGEMVEETYHTPHISATELAARQARGDNLIVLDGRPVDEYRKMTIPGSICCPNGELPLRIGALAPDPATTIVVNCAGRTRSIIGAQTLRHFGVPNPVLALENGTQGWFLADFTLDNGADRLYPAAPHDLAEAKARAARHAERCGVERVDAATLRGWLADPARNTFLCDIRTPEEFAAGSLPGAQNAPGGQLLQATDQYVGVHGARIVVFDGEGIRAPMVAAWLRQMGWNAFVLAEGLQATLPCAAPQGAQPAAPAALDVPGLAVLIAAGPVTLIDLRPSMTYRAGHLRGATWTVRPRLDGIATPPAGPVVLIAAEPGIAALAARDLADRGIRATHWHAGTPAAWKAAGLTVEATPDLPADADCIDFLFFVHDRHSGNREAAKQYLAWELGLVAQLDAQERAAWRFLPPGG